jgi:hypothetical protein
MREEAARREALIRAQAQSKANSSGGGGGGHTFAPGVRSHETGLYTFKCTCRGFIYDQTGRRVGGENVVLASGSKPVGDILANNYSISAITVNLVHSGVVASATAAGGPKGAIISGVQAYAGTAPIAATARVQLAKNDYSAQLLRTMSPNNNINYSIMMDSRNVTLTVGVSYNNNNSGVTTWNYPIHLMDRNDLLYLISNPMEGSPVTLR